ncbi:MAG: hypothetical protein KGI54_15920 [Pseudomonadota bacterium]|nr:hypothetical protein [Pseudomonadota bacterium]
MSNPFGLYTTGVSANGSVGTTGADIVVASGQYKQWVTVSNTHATQKLSLSFNNPATTADFTLPAGGAITLPFGIASNLYGIGSGAATTFATIGA